MLRRVALLYLGFLTFSFLIASPPAQGYNPRSVINAGCVNVPLPQVGGLANPPLPFIDGAPVLFKVTWSEGFNPQPSLACEVGVPVYPTTEIDRMFNDKLSALRDEVLKAVKAGVFQAAIRGDQIQSVSDTILQSVERELRAGALREVVEIKQQIESIEQRLKNLEGNRP